VESGGTLMTLATSVSVNSDFGDVRASYGLDGTFSASVQFANPSRTYGAADRWAVLQVSVEASVVASSGVSGIAAFAGTDLWINGVVTAPLEEIEPSKCSFPAGLSSFYCTLSRKALNTHTYVDLYGNVIVDVLENYCGIPSALISVIGSNVFPFRGVVTGTNAATEVAKLAEAAYCEFFTQVGGTLVVEPWKGSASPVDYVIPPEAVIKVSKKRSTDRGPTRLVVKGRHTGDHGCGPKSLYHDNSSPKAYRKDKCYQNGAPEPSSRLVFKNLTAQKQDLDNATFSLTGDLVFDHMTSADQKDSLAVVFADTSDQVGQGFVEDTDLKTISALITSRNTGSDTERHGTNSHRTKPIRQALTAADLALSRIAKLPAGGILAPNQTQESGGDGEDRNRVTCIVEDQGLVAEFGVVTEDVDNEYISDAFTAFIVAIRRFQRFRMRRNKYTVEVAYISGLELNDVVQFTLPDGSGDEVTGLLDSIELNYTAANSKATLTLQIDSFEDIGNSVYQAANLLVYSELCGINQIDWISSGDVVASCGYFVFEASANVYQPLILISGITYVLTVELTLLSGPGSFTVSCGGASTTATGTGLVTLSFSPVSSSTSLSFTSASGQWALTKPKITVSVIG
jgi:hypothetical protein